MCVSSGNTPYLASRAHKKCTNSLSALYFIRIAAAGDPEAFPAGLREQEPPSDWHCAGIHTEATGPQCSVR